MSIVTATLQIKINGGAPQTGGVVAATGDTCQLTAANKSGWGSPPTRWEIYNYPPSFALPAGWTSAGDDPVSPTYFCNGSADPPSFTLTPWGKFGTRVIALGRIIDESSMVETLSPNGQHDIVAREGSQFGGPKENWLYGAKKNLRTIDPLLGGGGGGGGGVTSVSGTAPIVSSGGATPAISISAASGGAAGSFAAADYSTLHTATNAATNSALCQRDASAGCAFAAVTATTVAASTSLTAPLVDRATSGVLAVGSTANVTALNLISGGTIAADSSTGVVALKKAGTTSTTITSNPGTDVTFDGLANKLIFASTTWVQFYAIGAHVTELDLTGTTGVIQVLADVQFLARAASHVFAAYNATFPRTLTAAAACTDVFDAACTSINVSQANNTTNGATGAAFNDHAQNCTGTTSTGGARNIASGTGTTKSGPINLSSGTTLQVKIDDNGATFSRAPLATSNATSGGGALTVDLALGGVQTITMTSSISALTVSNPQTQGIYEFVFIQDATGSRTLALPGSWKVSGGTFTLTATANKRDRITMRYDGSNYYEVSRAMNC